ncbi:MAG: RNase P subunit p30 family protein [Haloarculaceae archaeon]
MAGGGADEGKRGREEGRGLDEGERGRDDEDAVGTDGPGAYEAVHARPDGESTVARHALTASEYGFDGLVVRNHGGSDAEYDPDSIAEECGVDVVRGVEVRAEDPSRASGFVGSHRGEKTIVAVHGGSSAINRFAVEQPAVDVLAHPVRDGGEFNHVLAKAAARNGVHVEVTLSRVLRATGGTRVRALQSLRSLVEVIDHYDTPFVVSADPASHLQWRAPRELAAVGDLVGLSTADVRAGLAAWGRLAERNRHRQSDSFVEPGVSIVDEEE